MHPLGVVPVPGGGGEGLLTDGAGERLEPGVYFLVVLRPELGVEPPAAVVEGAGVLRHLVVGILVPRQMEGGGERLGAHVAEEGSQAGVSLLVAPQVRVVDERFAADVAPVVGDACV